MSPDTFCSSCKRRFPTEQAYRMHTGSHIHAFSHKCSECKNFFPSEGCLREHIARVHPEPPLQKPLDSPQLFCQDCTINFVTEKGLLDHRALIHSCCPRCKTAFASQAALHEHCQSCHAQSESQERKEGQDGNGTECPAKFPRSLSQSEQEKQAPMVLNHVSVGKPSPHAVTRLPSPSCLNAVQEGKPLHPTGWSQQATQQAPLVLDQATAKKKFQPAPEYNFNCKHCNKEFAARNALERHARDSHRHPRRFKCEICDGLPFYLESSLELHQQNDYLHQSKVAEKAASALPSTSQALQDQKKSSEQVLKDKPSLPERIQEGHVQPMKVAASRDIVDGRVQSTQAAASAKGKPQEVLSREIENGRVRAPVPSAKSNLPVEQPRVLQALVQHPPAISLGNGVRNNASNGLLGPAVEPKVAVLPAPPPLVECFFCQACSKGFQSQAALDQHHSSSTSCREQQRSACPSCCATFASPAGLEAHRKLFHGRQAGGFHFRCPKCQRGFDSQFALFQHSRDSHLQKQAPTASQNGQNPLPASNQRVNPSPDGHNPLPAPNQRVNPGGQVVQRPSTAGQRPQNAWMPKQTTEVPARGPLTAQHRRAIVAEEPVVPTPDNVARQMQGVGPATGGGGFGRDGVSEVRGDNQTNGLNGISETNGGRAPAVEVGRQADADTRPALRPKPTSVPERASNREEECIICLDARRDTLYVPCAHFSFCHQCALENFEKGNPCPECRSPIDSVLQL